jgi:hypothetical protein
MVFGHTFDALLSDSARARPLVVLYWCARGLTAPLFMIVSGWATTLSARRAGERGWRAVRARLPRVALLLALGVLLRLPGGSGHELWSGSWRTWEQLLAFDTLHLIAVGLLVASLVLALRWSAVAQGLLFLLLAAAAVSFGLWSPSLAPRTLPALALSQALGGTSPFPVLPWLAYVFIGAAIPLLAGDVRIRVAVGVGCAAMFGAAATWWPGFDGMSPSHPVLVSFRAGAALLVLAACEAVPRSAATRLREMTRSSLAIYVIHLPIVYGWFRFEGLAQRWGPHLAFPETALVAVLILSFAALVARSAQSAVASLPWGRVPKLLRAARSGTQRRPDDFTDRRMRDLRLARAAPEEPHGRRAGRGAGAAAEVTSGRGSSRLARGRGVSSVHPRRSRWSAGSDGTRSLPSRRSGS